MGAGKILNLPEREIHRTRAQRMEKAVRTHVGTFKHNDGVNKLQTEFSRSFQAFMEGKLQLCLRYFLPAPHKAAATLSAELKDAARRQCRSYDTYAALK